MRRSGRLGSVAIGACLLLAACGGGEPTPTFAPPDYSYLSKLRLTVGTIDIEDHAAQGAGADDLGATAPVPPDQALRQMAHDRLIAAGNSGTGTFTIDQASITGSGGGALDGHLAVHLDILTGRGGHAGYAEAHVSRRFVPGTDGPDAGTRAQLYELTRQMMQDMNVELEYQVRRTLRDWLVDASGAPVAGGVDQQPLPPPGSAPPGSAPVESAPVTSMPSSGVQVGTTPVGATPLGPAGGPVMLAPPATAPGAASGAGAIAAPVPPPAAAPVASPPPGFLQPPGAAPLPPPVPEGQ